MDYRKQQQVARLGHLLHEWVRYRTTPATRFWWSQLLTELCRSQGEARGLDKGLRIAAICCEGQEEIANPALELTAQDLAELPADGNYRTDDDL